MASAKARHKVGLGLLGSGVVGEAIQDIVFNDLKGQVGSDLELEIRKIYTRRPKEKKWFSNRPSLFTTKAEEVIDDPGVDIVVEVLGFQHEAELLTFRDYILRAFEKGKSVVTSDKAVLARFGKELWAAAKKHGSQLRFEACVGGGIPIIRSLTESFAVEEPEAIFGIVNGTCNYILSQMEKSGKPYADALKEAQQKGYAETNPTADVSGSDAEAKLLLLSAVAFGLQLPPGTTWRKGIEDIHAVDFRYAGRTGASTIKQLAVAKRTGHAVEVFVSPALERAIIFSPELMARLTRFASRVKKAAGRGSSAIATMFWSVPVGVRDHCCRRARYVCEVARGEGRFAGLPSLVPEGILRVQPAEEITGSFYVRFVVKDRAGIVGYIGQTSGRWRPTFPKSGSSAIAKRSCEP